MKSINISWDVLKRYFLKVLLFLLIPCSLFAQDGDGQAGTRSLFNFGFGARAMGMGNAFVASANDPTAVYWNPAGLDHIYQQSVTVFHASLYEGTLYDFIGYAYPTLDLGTFALGIARIGTGNILETDINNQEYDTFSWDAYRFFFSYGLKLPWDISTGLSIKVDRSAFTSTVQYSKAVGVGVGLDLGFMYKPKWSSLPILQDWSFGLNIQNLFSPQTKEGSEADILPLAVKFGIMKSLYFFGEGNAFNILLDFDKSMSTDLAFSFGTEYSFREMGKLRLGYTGEALAFGAGVQYDMFQVDYAFSNPSTEGMLDPVHRVSLSVNFGMNRDEMFQIVEQLRLQEEEKVITEMRESDKQKFIADHLQMAHAYFQDKKYLDAVVEYQQVIGIDPFHQNAKIMLDSSNALLQNEFEDRQTSAVIVALDKDRAEANRRFVDEHFEKGRLLLDQRQYTQSLIEFNLALERDQNNQSLIDAIQTTRRRLNEDVNGLVRRGRQEFQNENYSESLRLLSEARLLSNDDPVVKKEVDTLIERVKLQENIQKGLMLYDIGQYEQALNLFESALELDPENQFIKQYYNKSKIEALDESTAMDPETERRYLEGVNKFLLGKYKEAITIWEEILKDHPYNKKVVEAIDGAQARLKRSKSD